MADLPERRVTHPAFMRPRHTVTVIHLLLLRLHLRHADFIAGVTDDERLLQDHLRHETLRLGRYLGLFSRVTLHVSLQDGAGAERLVAHVALVRFRM